MGSGELEGFCRGGRRRKRVADAEGKFVAGLHHAVGGCGCGEGMIWFRQLFGIAQMTLATDDFEKGPAVEYA